MAKSNTIQFKGTFDGSQILNELKKVRASMSEAGASDTLFKNVDKDIVATEKLVNDMMAQIQKGFSNTKEISAFEKQISKLQTNFLKISTGLKGANLSENFTFNSPEIAKLTQEINRLTAAQDRLKESSKNALATAGHNIGFNQDDVKEIQKAIDANEDLEESLIRVAKAKEKAAKANAGQTGMATDAGKKYIADAKAGLSLEDLGATAMSGKTAKGPDDARARGTGGKLKGTRDKRRLDEDKAMAAVNETYQQALEETVKNGGSAVDAVEAMKKALADYGVQLSNTERLQENFAESLEGFYTGDIVGVGQKSAVTKAQKAGRTNAQGEFELSNDARRQIVNNSQITAYNQNLEQVSQKERELAIERERLVDKAIQKQNEHNDTIKQAEEDTEKNIEAIKGMAAATKEASDAQDKITHSFDKIKDYIKDFLSLGSAISGLRSIFQQTFNDVKTLDKSFAEIAMVTDYSVGQMWESYNQYAEMANELGQTTESVVQASGLFYQQGLDTAESLTLTKDTMELATLAGLDFSEATSQMTAALRGFKMEMNEGNRVTDVYSELAAKAAADVEGISYAMTKTASIAESAGMEFETTAAFLTQMIETTQEAPENIGTAMKTIIARFTELKTNVAGTGESEFEDLDYNKVDTALKSVGVSIKDTNGQFRDLDDVFLELSGKWDTLDRNTQRYIATIAAGSRQQSRFIAMMDNYSRTIELVDVAQGSAGKSSEQFAKYQDTLEYKINQLNNSWEQLRVNFMNSDFFKGVVDLVGDLAEYLSDLNLYEIIMHLGAVFVALQKITKISEGAKSAFGALMSGEGGIKDAFKEGYKGKKSEPQKMKEAHEQGGEAIQRNIQEGGISAAAAIQNAIQEEEDSLENLSDAVEQAGSQMADVIEESGNDAADEMQQAIEEGGIHAAENIAAATGTDFKAKDGKGFKVDDILNQAARAEEEGDIQKAEELLAQALGVEEGKIEDKETEESTQESSEIESVVENIQEVFDEGGEASDEEPRVSISEESQRRIDELTQQLNDTDEGRVGTRERLQQEIDELNAGNTPKKKWYQSDGNTLRQNLADVKGIKNASGRGAAAKFVSKGILKALPGIFDAAEIGYMIGNAAGTYLESKTKEKQEKEEAFYASAISEIEKVYNIASSSLAKKETQVLADAQKTIQNYSTRTFLSDAQQQELTDAITLMNEQYPELVESYDENSGKISLLTEKIEEEIELQKKQNDNQLREEAAAISTQSAKGYGKIAADWKNDKASSINEDSIFANTAAVMGTTTAIGAAIGTIIPGIGNAVGAVVGGAIGLLVGGIQGIFVENTKQNTVNVEETISKLSQLDKEMQQKLFDELGVENITTLEKMMEKDEKYHQEVIDTMSDILEEVAWDNTKENAEKAMEAYVSGYSFENNKGEEIQLDSKFVEQFIDEGAAEEIAAINNAIAKEDLQKIQDEGTSKEDRQAVMKKYSFIDSEGVEKNLADYYYGDGGVWSRYEQLLDGDGKIKDILTEQEREIYKELFGTEDYSKYAGSEASKEFLTDKALNEYVADLLGIESEDEIEKLSEFTKNVNYEDWMERYNEILSGNLTPEQMETELASLQQEMAAQGISEDVYTTFAGREGEGAYQELLVTTQENMKKLIKDGWDINLLNRMNAQTINSFYNSIANLSGDEAEATARRIRNTYQGIIDKALEGDVSQETKERAASFLASLTPDTFDSSQTVEYEKQLVSMGYSSTEAAEMIAQLNDELEKYNLTNPITQTKGFKEGLKALTDALTTAKEEMSAFKDVAFDVAENGLSSENILSLIEQGKSHTIDIETGKIDYADVSTAFAVGRLEASEEAWNSAMNDENLSEKEREDLVLLSYAEKLAIVEDQEDTQDRLNDAIEKEEDAIKNVTDARKAALDAEKAYIEAVEGSDYWRPSVDAMSNYTKELEKIKEKVEDINTELTESESLQEKINLLSQKNSADSEASVNRQAQIQVYKKAIEENQKWMSENAQQYASLQEDGTYILNHDALADASVPDTWKEEIERKMEETEEWNSTVEQLTKEELESTKQREQELRQYRDEYLSFLESGAEILKQQAEDEVKNLEDKYNAMEEADNNYLDALEEAIEKQRQLREREDSFNDLAQQEKKLSLMQRDTSGANRKEIQELEKDTEEKRQDLLDEEIDTMIDGMRQLYESQTELRNEEVELKNAIIEETNYTKQFAEMASTWTSVEDASAFYLENTDTSNMITEEIEAAMLTFEDAYKQGSIYMAATSEEVTGFTEATTEQIKAKIDENGEYLTTNSEAITNQVIADTTEAATEAKEAWQEAQDKVSDYEEELSKASQLREQWEINAEQSQAAMLKAMTSNFETETTEMQKITIQALQRLFEDDYIMEQLGLTQEQFKGILNADIMNAFSDEEKIRKELGFSEEQLSLLKSIEQTKDSVGRKKLEKQYMEKYGNHYSEYSQEVGQYGLDTDEEMLKKHLSAYQEAKETSKSNANVTYQKDEQEISQAWVKLAEIGYKEFSGQPTPEEISNNNLGYAIDHNGKTRYIGADYQAYANDCRTAGLGVRKVETYNENGVLKSKYSKYATGGLVNYTGPAWVDGTPSKPEAFLSAQDTERIGNAAKLLADLPILNSTSNANNAVSSNIGDTSIEIHINVESLASDYDVDQMIERVKNDILDVSKPTGTSVILHK